METGRRFFSPSSSPSVILRRVESTFQSFCRQPCQNSRAKSSLANHRRPRRSNTPSSSSSPKQQSENLPMLQVSEIFKSVQGEGPFVGRPSVFLRLGVCNLSCVWCDTPYTWLFSHDRLKKVINRLPPSSSSHTNLKVYDKQHELDRQSLHDVIHHVSTLAGHHVRNIVITGGEPLLHKKPLLHVVREFTKRGLSIEFETNGTISPNGLLSACHHHDHHQIHLNVSPKLSNSLQPRTTRINLPVLKECLTFPSAVLKFVVDGYRDIEELLQVVRDTGVEPSRVYLMPQGSDSEEIEEKGRWLVDICLQHGFHYSHRLHVELWGAKRGV